MPLRQESTKSCRHTVRKIPPAGPGSDLAVCVEPFSCLCLPGCFRHLVVQVSVQPKNCCGVGHQPRSTAGAPPESGPRTAARSAPRPGKPQGSPRLHGSHVCPGTGRGPCRALPQRYGNGWEGHDRIGSRHCRTTGASVCDGRALASQPSKPSCTKPWTLPWARPTAAFARAMPPTT